MADRLFSDPELAALYDLFSPNEGRGDFAFYLPMIMSAGSVLDVGCGTGALLHLTLDEGHEGRLVGLDPASGMIEQARRRSGIEWIHGDLSSVEFDSEFDLVVMSGHAFQVFVEDKELRLGLSAVRRSLKEAGRFAFETRNPLARAWEQWDREYSGVATEAAGAKVSVEVEVDEPVIGDIVRFSHTFSSDRWEQPKVSRSVLRFLDLQTLNSLLVEAGFVVEEQFGGWDRSELEDASPEIITVARRRDAGDSA